MLISVGSIAALSMFMGLVRAQLLPNVNRRAAVKTP